MEHIKNIDLVTSRIKSFTVGDLRQIISFNYYVDLMDEYNSSNMEICFVVDPNHDAEKLKVTLRFNNVSGFKLDRVGNIIYLSSLEITDMKEQGWDSGQRFIVRDYEDDKFELKCSLVEVISVEDLYS